MQTKFGIWLANFAAGGPSTYSALQHRYKPFHLFYKVLGLNSFAFDGTHQPNISKIGGVYALILAAGYLGLHLYAVGAFVSSDELMDEVVATTNEVVLGIDIYSTYSGLVTIVSIIVSSTIQQGKLAAAIRLLFEVDELFANHFAATVDNARWQLTVFGFHVVGVSAVMAMEYKDCIMFISKFIFKAVTNCYTICFIQLLFFVMAEIHFNSHLLLVHARFTATNKRLKHFCESGDQRVGDLLAMITIYKKLEECHKLINSFFAFSNCLVITIRSILVATLAYELVLKLINYDVDIENDNGEFMKQIVNSSLWTMWMLCELFFLFFISHITEEEATRTITVLQFSLADGNTQIDHLIGNFIYKLKYPVKTSPFGLFTMNMASFFSLTGAMSYLLVMVQLNSKSIK